MAPCQTNSQGPDVVQAALRAVPPYCCTADLLFKAPPELVDLALSLRVPDISRLFTNTFCELTALLELVGRSQEPGWINPDDPAQQAPAAGVAGAAESRHAASRAASRSPSASTGSGGAPTEPLSGSQRPHLQHMEELQDVVDRFYGMLGIIFALQPVPLLEAACLNHRTQEQVAPPKQHWQVSTKHAAKIIVCLPSHTVLQFELRTAALPVLFIEVSGCSSGQPPEGPNQWECVEMHHRPGCCTAWRVCTRQHTHVLFPVQAVLRRLQLTPSQAAYLDTALAQVGMTHMAKRQYCIFYPHSCSNLIIPPPTHGTGRGL